MIRLALFLAGAALLVATVAAFAQQPERWQQALQCFDVVGGNIPMRVNRCNGETWRLVQTPNGASRWFPVIVEPSEYTAVKRRLPPMPVISDEPPKVMSDGQR